MKYRLDEKTVGEMIIRQMEMRIETTKRVKDLTPDDHRDPYLSKVHYAHDLQIKVLEESVKDARLLMDNLEFDEN